jgi:hypothetical protein
MAVISESFKDIYWTRVAACLVTFFGWPPEEVRQRVTESRVQLDAEPDEEVEALAYHDEPFYVARDLAGCDHRIDLDNPERATMYDAILDRTRAVAL